MSFSDVFDLSEVEMLNNAAAGFLASAAKAKPVLHQHDIDTATDAIARAFRKGMLPDFASFGDYPERLYAYLVGYDSIVFKQQAITEWDVDENGETFHFDNVIDYANLVPGELRRRGLLEMRNVYLCECPVKIRKGWVYPSTEGAVVISDKKEADFSMLKEDGLRTIIGYHAVACRYLADSLEKQEDPLEELFIGKPKLLLVYRFLRDAGRYVSMDELLELTNYEIQKRAIEKYIRRIEELISDAGREIDRPHGKGLFKLRTRTDKLVREK